MAYVTFPVGTVRGPFTCGKGGFITGHNRGVQFCVQTPTGWVYFIENAWEEGKARERAEKFAEKTLASLK